jgi:hypothetical protein
VAIVETIKSTDWLSETAKHLKIKPNKMYEIVKVGVRFWKIKATPEHLAATQKFYKIT